MDAFWERDRYTRQLPNLCFARWTSEPSIVSAHHGGHPAWLLLLLAASLMAAAATADRHEVGGHRDDEIFYLIVQVGDVALLL